MSLSLLGSGELPNDDDLGHSNSQCTCLTVRSLRLQSHTMQSACCTSAVTSQCRVLAVRLPSHHNAGCLLYVCSRVAMQSACCTSAVTSQCRVLAVRLQSRRNAECLLYVCSHVTMQAACCTSAVTSQCRVLAVRLQSHRNAGCLLLLTVF